VDTLRNNLRDAASPYRTQPAKPDVKQGLRTDIDSPLRSHVEPCRIRVRIAKPAQQDHESSRCEISAYDILSLSRGAEYHWLIHSCPMERELCHAARRPAVPSRIPPARPESSDARYRVRITLRGVRFTEATALTDREDTDDRGTRPDQTFRRQDRSRQPIVPGPTGARHRVPRAERRGQVHHDADDPGTRPPLERKCPRRRQAIRATHESDARDRCPARGQIRPPGAQRLQPPVVPGTSRRHSEAPGTRGTGTRRITGRGEASHRWVLARNVTTTRTGTGTARRPTNPDARRTGQRARPRGHPLGSRTAQESRRGGTLRVRLEPSDE